LSIVKISNNINQVHFITTSENVLISPFQRLKLMKTQLTSQRNSGETARSCDNAIFFPNSMAERLVGKPLNFALIGVIQHYGS